MDSIHVERPGAYALRLDRNAVSMCAGSMRGDDCLRLHKSTLYRRERGMALAMLGITSLALFVIAGFKTSDTAIVTPSVLIHRVSVGVLTVCFPAACLVLVPALRGDRRWKSLALYSGVVGAIGLILDISGASIPRDLQQGVAGLWEKVFVANGLIWCQVFAVRLLRVSHQTPTRDGG